jgi:fatty-acyl-CoA synthase
LIENIEDQIPSIKKIVAMDEDHPIWESYASWRDGQSKDNPNLVGEFEDDVIQLYTSGTTGHPKGVRMTNKNLLASTPMVEKRWGADWHEKTVNFVLSPLFHVAGSNIVVMGIIFGCKNIIIPEPDPTKILELIESEKIETAFMVPALILFLLQHPNCSKTDFSSLRQIVYGASPIAQDTLLKAVEVMQCDFWQVYGLTESTGIGTTLSPADHNVDLGKLRSCGKPYPGVEIKITDESNNTVGHNEVGEILIKSDVIMKGYWNRPEANDNSIIDDWFYTGDAGYLDEDGFLYIHDRVKDMIISGGENIYPAEVENALMSHPDIADAAAVGIPDDKWGETVKGFVILKQDSNITEKEIIAYTKDQIAAYKCPSSIDFITEMPRNPSGKILRRELRAPFWDDAERNVS